MPKPKLVNHLPLLNHVLAHWSQVETALGEAVTLPDGTTRDGAQDLATSLQDSDSSLLVNRNTLMSAQGGRNEARDAAHTAGKQARKSLRGLAKNVPDVLGLPQVPAKTCAPAVLATALDDITDIWGRVNALPQASVPAAKLPLRIPLKEGETPILLTREQFQARTQTLRTCGQSLTEAEDAVRVGIVERDTLHDRAAEVIKDYGTVVRGLLYDGHPLLKTLPTLTG
jgi:hypothetical protein